MRRMYDDGEDCYLLHHARATRTTRCRRCRRASTEGIVRGMYKLDQRMSRRRSAARATVRQRRDPARGAAGAGDSGRAVRRVERRLERDQLQGAAPRRPRLRPLEPAAPDRDAAAARISSRCSRDAKGPFVAASDYMRAVPSRSIPWVPGGLFVLGTDGFGRSEARPAAAAVLRGRRRVHHRRRPDPPGRTATFDRAKIAAAIRDLGIDPEKSDPFAV